MGRTEIIGQLVDVIEGGIAPAKVVMEEGRFTEVAPLPEAPRRFLLPGLIDSHTHALWGGRRDLFECFVGYAETLEQLFAAVTARAASLPEGVWIEGGPWRFEHAAQLARGQRLVLAEQALDTEAHVVQPPGGVEARTEDEAEVHRRRRRAKGHRQNPAKPALLPEITLQTRKESHSRKEGDAGSLPAARPA